MTGRIGQQIGHYRLVKLLGSGGFAEVYQGKHIHIEKDAAIKILISDDDEKGFQSEAQTIAQLKHEHIIDVLDFGFEQGNPYLVMEYIDGGTLRQRHPKGSRVSLTEMLQYLKQITAALQYAHDRKVIHRDIKPENILIRANGDLVLSDFGITTVAHGESSLVTTTYIGTPAYSAPEQFDGKPRPASDQYALGILFYELLTGRRPFLGPNLYEYYTQHRDQPPPSMPETTEKIAAVIFKALAKEPKERFASIDEFERAFEEALPSRDRKNLGPAKEHDHFATLVDERAKELSAAVYLPTTRRIRQLNSVKKARDLKLTWSPDGKYFAYYDYLSEKDAHRGNVPPVLWVSDARGFYRDEYHRGVGDFWWSPKGRYFFTKVHRKTLLTFVAELSEIGDTYRPIIKALDRHMGKLLGEYPGEFVLGSPDDRYFVVWGASKNAQIWDMEAQKQVGNYPRCFDFIWSPDGKYLAFSSREKSRLTESVCIWDVQEKKLVGEYPGSTPNWWPRSTHPTQDWWSLPTPNCWSPNSVYLAYISVPSKIFGSEENETTFSVNIWNVLKNEKVGEFEGYRFPDTYTHSFPVRYTWSSNSRYFLCHFSDAEGGYPVYGRYRVVVWDVEGNRPVGNYKSFGSHFSWSPDGKYLSLDEGDYHDRAAQIWEIETQREIVRFPLHAYRASRIDWLPDSKHFVFHNQRFHIWNVETNTAILSIDGSNIFWSADGRFLCIVSHGSLDIWDITERRCIGKVGQPDEIYHIWWQPHTANPVFVTDKGELYIVEHYSRVLKVGSDRSVT